MEFIRGQLERKVASPQPFPLRPAVFFPSQQLFSQPAVPPQPADLFHSQQLFSLFFQLGAFFFQQVFPPGSQQPFFSTPPLPRVVKSGPGSDAGDAAWKNAAVAGGSPPLLPVDLAASAGHPPAIPSGVGLEDSPGGGSILMEVNGGKAGGGREKVGMVSASTYLIPGDGTPLKSTPGRAPPPAIPLGGWLGVP